jgi:hypothetical protein
VDHVPEARLEVAERFGGPVGPLGVGRGFDRVDHQVVRQRVLRVESEHGLEGRDEILGPRLRLAVGRPEVPRAQVGQGLGEERAHVGVPREGLPHPARAPG